MRTTQLLVQSLRRLAAGRRAQVLPSSGRGALGRGGGAPRPRTICCSAVALDEFRPCHRSSVVKKSLQGSFESSPNRAFSLATTTAHDDTSNDPTSPPPAAHEQHRGLPFLLADIGEGIKEVELLQWFCQPGDAIQQFDKVCEVQSDKATVEITSRYDGIVAALAGDVGDMMQVGQALLFFTHDAEQQQQQQDDDQYGHSSGSLLLEDTETEPQDERLRIPSVASQFHLASDDHDNEAVTQNSNRMHDKFSTSPAVRKLGKEYNLDLSTIHGSGPKGRLLKTDVLTYLQEQGLRKAHEDTAADPTATATATPTPTDDIVVAPQHYISEEDEIHTMRGYNRLMVKSMTAALEIPHMCFGDELEVSKLLECRRELKEAQHHVGILTFLLKACSLALQQYPVCNAVVHDLEQCQLKLLKSHNLGIAMDTPRGLVVPVISNVQSKSLLEIQSQVDRLKVLAAESKLTAQDLQPPTFTLSNIGSISGTYMQPVIVPPQLAMGAVGQLQRLPRFDKDDNVYAADIMHVSWAGDHRFLDGATLARFHLAFKTMVENPVHMLVHLK